MTGLAVLLTSYVALNTLVFLGMSLGKVIPWPQPLHPTAVRSWRPLTQQRAMAGGTEGKAAKHGIAHHFILALALGLNVAYGLISPRSGK